MKPIHLTLACLALVPLGTVLLAAQDDTPVIQDVPTEEVPKEEGIPADTEIITTESGLKYSVLRAGNGKEMPVYGDVVSVHYTGWLPDGTKFDSSRDRGEPTEFPLGRVIEGWNEGLPLMSPGAHFKFTIPGEMAYAKNPPPGSGIPIDGTLIFEVELLSIPHRVLPHVAWNAENPAIVSLDGDVQFQMLTKGEGAPASEADHVFFDYAVYNDAGELADSSTFRGMVGTAPKLPSAPFIEEALKSMPVGSHMLLSVPENFGQPAVAKVEGHESVRMNFQVKVLKTMVFTTPEFAIPAPEEMTTTESGLQYKVLEEGIGKLPKASSQFTAHYCGWTRDGNQFDCSYSRDPLTMPVNGVVQGWIEGLQLMKEGSKYLFIIPSELGYGSRGQGSIGPNEDLIFVVQLLATDGR